MSVLMVSEHPPAAGHHHDLTSRSGKHKQQGRVSQGCKGKGHRSRDEDGRSHSQCWTWCFSPRFPPLRKVFNSHKPNKQRVLGWLFRNMKSKRQALGFGRTAKHHALLTQASLFLSETGPRLLTEQLLKVIIFSLGKHSSTICNCF